MLRQWRLGVDSEEDIFPVYEETAVILGNGSSLLKAGNIHQEFGKVVVFGVNRVFFKEYSRFWPIHYYLALDRYCWQNHMEEIDHCRPLRKFAHIRYSVFPIQDAAWFEIASEPMAFSRTPGPIGHGHTSVYPCMQLAAMMGVKRVVLCGVDTDKESGRTHLHGDTNRPQKNWDKILNGIDAGIEELQKIGIEVIRVGGEKKCQIAI